MQNFLPKHPFFFRARPEDGEGKKRNKGDFESMCAKVTTHASKKVAKAEVNLNYWLWTIELIMDCFDCVFISTGDLAWTVWYIEKYGEVICFLINLFGNVFQTSGEIGLIMLLYVNLRYEKSI